MWIAIAFCLPACAESAETPDAGPPTIEIGTGSRSFEAISDGDVLSVITGPQGGFHFVGSVRASNVNAGDPNNLQSMSNPTTQFEVFANGVKVDADASTYTQGLRTGESGAEMLGRFIILEIPNAGQLDGMSLRFVVTIRDVDGVVISDERTVVAQAQ